MSTTKAREEGFYWVIVGHSWAGNRLLGTRRLAARRRLQEAVTVASDRLVFKSSRAPR